MDRNAKIHQVSIRSWRRSRSVLTATFLACTCTAAAMTNECSSRVYTGLMVLTMIFAGIAFVLLALKVAETGPRSFREPPILASLLFFSPLLYLAVMVGILLAAGLLALVVGLLAD